MSSVGAGLVGGALAQRVLDDPEAGVGLAQPGAQVGDLGDRDPAVVDREDRLGGSDLLGDLVYDGCLLLFVHGWLSLTRNARRSGGRSEASHTGATAAPAGSFELSACSGLTRPPPEVSGIVSLTGN